MAQQRAGTPRPHDWDADLGVLGVALSDDGRPEPVRRVLDVALIVLNRALVWTDMRKGCHRPLVKASSITLQGHRQRLNIGADVYTLHATWDATALLHQHQ